MEFSDYEQAALATAIYPKGFRGLSYVISKLNGEAGEVAEAFGKAIRDDGYPVEGALSPERRVALLKEAGDVLWYLAALCRELNSSLSVVAAANVAKLKDRKERGVLQGSGDNR